MEKASAPAGALALWDGPPPRTLPKGTVERGVFVSAGRISSGNGQNGLSAQGGTTRSRGVLIVESPVENVDNPLFSPWQWGKIPAGVLKTLWKV